MEKQKRLQGNSTLFSPPKEAPNGEGGGEKKEKKQIKNTNNITITDKKKKIHLPILNVYKKRKK